MEFVLVSQRRKIKLQISKHASDKGHGRKYHLSIGIAFVIGILVSSSVLLIVNHIWSRQSVLINRDELSFKVVGQRGVISLMNLSDSDLESVDIVEMNIAVARGIQGLENLDYVQYRQTIDTWTNQFKEWLPTVEYAFHQNPSKYKNDINFFRLGMLAQFLDQQIGIAYVKDHKKAIRVANKKGVKPQIAYTNPGHLLLHGLIDSKRGTCGTMPTLHVAIGRRLGWSVGLACANSHYICRYEDGKNIYNIETTDTGHGGFAAGSDLDYIKSAGISDKAITVGSDLRKLTAREMLGVFVQARARFYADTGKVKLAARDYALAHTLFPNSRQVYIGLVGNLLPVGEKLFNSDEHGHPSSLLEYLGQRYTRIQKR